MVAKSKETVIIPNDEGVTLNQLASIAAAQQYQDADDVDEKTDEDYLQEVFAELGGSGSAKVNVYQVEVGKPLAFVGSFAPDMFSIEAIQQSYGAGEYAVHVRVDGRIKSKRTIRIAKPRETVQQNNNGISAQDVASIVRDTVRDLIPRENTPVKSTKDMLDEMLLMKQILASDNQKSGGVDDFLKMLEVAKGLVNPNSEPPEPSTSQILMKGLESVAPILAAGMAQNQQNLQRQQPVYNQPSKPVPVVDNVTSELPVESVVQNEIIPVESEPAMNLQEKMMLSLLVANAEKDNDPETYANMILDLVGDDVALEMLNRPDWFQMLIEKEPRAQSFERWFTELRAIILEVATDTKTLTTEQNNVINDGNSNTETVTDAVLTQQ